MPAQRRLTLVVSASLILAAGVWVAVLPELISVSTATWATLAIGVCAMVALKFNRHAELPDSVKLH
jgi:hypothetical protein